MRRLRWIIMSPCALASLAGGCEDECGPGYVPHEHLCRAVGGEADGGEPSTGAAAGAAGTCDGSTFGHTCLTVGDCECDADFCAGIPGQEGICTRTGCGDDPGVCPSDWECTDLAPFGPDLPTICTPP